MKNMFCRCARFITTTYALLGFIHCGAVSAAVAEPSEATMLDCPLRDAPWSVETPLMDVL
ncbi:MAG: hypothetical protein HKN19_10705, partial [Halioglobus sp.]|nr:hypothetical protein [Halioglobus sp.]